MSSRSVVNDPLKTFRWRVYINGVLRTAFMECSGLSSKVDVVEYGEGGSDTNQKSPGRKQYEPISLKTGRFAPGATGADDLFDLAMRSHERGVVGASSEIRETLEIAVHDNFDVECERWEVVECWVSDWVPVPGLGIASEAMLESVVVQHEGFKRVFP